MSLVPAGADVDTDRDDSPSLAPVLDTLVVTGTRTERVLEEVPVRTQIVTAEDLDRLQARDLADALRSVPGLYLREIIGKQGIEVNMQGFDGDRILVLIDGVPAPMSTNSTVDITQITVADVERIEIVRGATSALYGSSAIGGVINVITRRAVRSGYRLQAEAGAYTDTDRGEGSVPQGGLLLARGDWVGERLAVGLTADLRRDDGFSLDPEQFAQAVQSARRQNLSARIEWSPQAETTLSLRPTWFKEDKSQRLAIALPGGLEGRRLRSESFRQPGIVARAEHRSETRGLFSGLLSWSEFDNRSGTETVAGAPINERNARIEYRRFEGQWSHWIGDRHQFTAGVVGREEQLDQTQTNWVAGQPVVVDEIPGDARQRNLEAFAQDNWFVSDDFELVVGARIQHDSDFGGFIAPSASGLRALYTDTGRVNVRASIGRGYRVPNLKERFFEFDQSSLGYRVVGNPDLEPEQSVSIQAGVEWIPAASDAPRMEANAFYNTIRDLITTEFNAERSAAEGLQVFDYQNLDRARTYGLETGANWRFAKGWFVDLGYTWLIAEDRTTGNTLTQRPRHQLKTEWGYTHDRWQISVQSDSQSSEFLDAANTVRSSAWTRLNLRTRWQQGSTTWLLGVDNLLNNTPRASDLTDASPPRGRYLYLGVRFDGVF